MPLLGLLDPSRGAFLWGAWGYTVTKELANAMFASFSFMRQTGLEMRPALALKSSIIQKSPILRTLR